MVQVAWRSSGWTTSQWTLWMQYGSRRWPRAVRCCKMKKRRRKKRRRWKKMREDQQQLWQQHLQWNKTTARTTSVDEAASVWRAPGQGITHVAVDPAGEDATANKVTGLLIYWGMFQSFTKFMRFKLLTLVLLRSLVFGHVTLCRISVLKHCGAFIFKDKAWTTWSWRWRNYGPLKCRNPTTSETALHPRSHTSSTKLF